jgi:hypothetical protein
VPAARRHRRLTVWIALVAMLAFALMPTVSRALAFAQGGSNWTEICTPQGMQWVSADGERTDAPPDGTPARADPCHFCQLAQAGGAPLPATAPALVLPLASAEPPRLFLLAARPQHAWCSAQPRAPPFRA